MPGLRTRNYELSPVPVADFLPGVMKSSSLYMTQSLLELTQELSWFLEGKKKYGEISTLLSETCLRGMRTVWSKNLECDDGTFQII